MPNYYNPYYQQPQMNYQPQQIPSQIQNNGFISVRSELEARNYPVAPGNSITFKDETAPYVYTKTMGFSQLDRPNFEKYKLVKEEVNDNQEIVKSVVNESDIADIKSEIERLWGEINEIKSHDDTKPAQTSRRKKDGDD